jgi:Fic family protein
MLPEDFKKDRSGDLVRTLQGKWAFVPNPLPPAIEYSPTLVSRLSEADAALAELSGVGRQLANPALLIGPYLNVEARLSSQIEGTVASYADMFVDQIEHGGDARNEVREVNNYVRALHFGVDQLGAIPFSLRLVRELHRVLMTGVRGQHRSPGEFRQSQNFVGAAGTNESTAIYVPPPVPQMQAALDSWERFAHDDRHDLPELIRCALLHVQFESIHPFNDGNGRTGRLLIPLYLMQRGRLSRPLLYLSAYIESRRRDYYDLLQRTRTHGAWTDWLEFFLRGITVTARGALVQTQALLDLRVELVREARDVPNAEVLIDALFSNPFTTLPATTRTIGKTTPTASTLINTLQARGILEEVTGKQRGRIYVVRRILAIIERAESI